MLKSNYQFTIALEAHTMAALEDFVQEKGLAVKNVQEAAAEALRVLMEEYRSHKGATN